MCVWVHFAMSGDPSSEAEVTRCLAQAGVTCCAHGAHNACSAGIVCFSAVTDELCDLLHRVSDSGTARVFAIALGTADLGRNTWRLLNAGASEVFAWKHWSNAAGEIAARLERWDAIDQLVESPLVRNTFVGEGVTWQRITRRIVELGRFTQANVLVLGESGTGKELVAQLVHALDARERKGELVVLDCSTIVPELSGSEFFGHERGAFTGALHVRDGAFALADRGTLFLDEVGELPLSLQGQLLRAVQERTYKRVGGNTWHSTDFRLVCATNRDLGEAVSRGEFRHDLYHRIANWTLRLPPLRERPHDVLRLARYFMQQMRPNGEAPQFDQSVSQYLVQRDYPGNVRELRQLISRIADRHLGPGPVTAGDIPEDERPHEPLRLNEWRDESFEGAIHRALSLGVRLKEIGRAAEETAVSIAMDEENGSLRRAASRLGVTDRALQMRRVSANRSRRPI